MQADSEKKMVESDNSAIAALPASSPTLSSARLHGSERKSHRLRKFGSASSQGSPSLKSSDISSIASFRHLGTPTLKKFRYEEDEPTTRVPPGTVLAKPWLGRKTKLHFARYIIYMGIILGIGIAAAVSYLEYATVPHLGPITLVFEDNFETFNTSVWNREVSVGGYGNSEFEWTTAFDENSHVEDGVLYITPTLTNATLTDAQILNGYTLNLTQDGSCTFTSPSDCVVTSNSSLSKVINPVKSARLSTKGTVSLKWGKVEVEAKMPQGDWIWPAIWMLPVDDVYGAWPASGEIDIVESRGNAPGYGIGGRERATSTLHWGPLAALDRYRLTEAWISDFRVDYSQEFHTFGLEWSPKFMRFYIDSRLQTVMEIDLSKRSLWDKGDFPVSVQNDSQIIPVTDPWITSKEPSAPFDQEFYLLLSVAVGGQNGWFPDGMGGKTWVDADPKAMADFYNASSTSSWPSDPKDRSMAIRSVKIWQKD